MRLRFLFGVYGPEGEEAAVTAIVEYGRDAESKDESDPQPRSANAQYKGTKVANRQVDNDVGDECVAHQDRYVLYASEDADQDGL